jgi:UDP-glucose 4-epimerase
MSESRHPRPDESPAQDTETHEPVERAPSEVLVIGGGGFIGSHLVDRLVAERVSVDVVDDLSSGSLANLADARNSARLTGAEMRIHTVDAGAAELGNLISLRRPRQIVHLALLPPGRTTPADLGRSFSSMLTALEAARLAAVTKVVVLLPATVMYGQPATRELPIKEIPIVPRGVRGVVAKAIIDLLTVYRERHGIEFTALAASTVFGSRQRQSRGVVATLLQAAAQGEPARLTGDGRQTRDFVFVDDVVDAIMRARQRGSGLVVNVGTGVQTSLRDLATLINSGGPKPTFVAERPDELMRFSVSPVRARIHLGWAPWTSLADGLAAIGATRDPHDR